MRRIQGNKKPSQKPIGDEDSDQAKKAKTQADIHFHDILSNHHRVSAYAERDKGNQKLGEDHLKRFLEHEKKIRELKESTQAQ